LQKFIKKEIPSERAHGFQMIL